MRRHVLLVVLSVAAGAATLVPGAARATAPSVVVRVLSNRADLVSGGDALTEVSVVGAPASALRVEVNGVDVTPGFVERPPGRHVGLVTGLREGDNDVVAVVEGAAARLVVTSHPSEGPVFSGPHLHPWLCTTAANGLGEPVDAAACSAPAKVEFFYQRTGTTTFLAYDPANPPTDVRPVTTDDGRTVPYIVRQETGTMNRGIYRIAVLWDPAKPADEQVGWTRKLYYLFGASCGTMHSQGTAPNVQAGTSGQSGSSLARGFMVASSSLNTLGTNCNTVLSAEAMMMLKEHIVDHYGEIRFTFGNGVSGGSIGQNMVANSYPGLLQGITESSAFTDTESTLNELIDCHLLMRYFSASAWNASAMAAVAGHGPSASSCAGWDAQLAHVEDPKNGTGLPADQAYSPDKNPGGSRGRVEDFERNVWGLRTPDLWSAPERAVGQGFARKPYDNVGVQYGLVALREGRITAEQFVDLNEKVGGVDVDFNATPQRSLRDPESGRIAYASGRLNGAQHLNDVAMIDYRQYGNLDAYGIHTMYHSFALEERIRKASGSADNHVVWRGGWKRQPFDVMDAWLTAVEADRSDLPRAEKLARHRPAEARDGCFIGSYPLADDQCDTVWPYYGAPRIAAGGPLSHDVMKCRLKPLDRADPAHGPTSFTDAQWARLQAAFPGGACDWTKPDPDATPSVPWMTYADGPGTGHPLPPAPVSRPV